MNTDNQETWRYHGEILESSLHKIVIKAYFNRDDFELNGIWLRRNDYFIETYYSDRWYNIFQIHDQDDGQIKGWYCNVTKPAEISDLDISYIDLALDLLVFPDGTQLVLDQDEFEDLEIEEEICRKALKGLEDLQQLFHSVDFEDLPDLIN
jgi:protein associated with RNAse G/E